MGLLGLVKKKNAPKLRAHVEAHATTKEANPEP